MEQPNIHTLGYRVIDYSTKESIGLRLILRAAEETLSEENLLTLCWSDTDSGHAQRERTRMLLNAICTYYNTCNIDDYDLVNVQLRGIVASMAKARTAVGMDFCWRLWYTSEDEHIYKHTHSNTYLRIVSDLFSEELTEHEVHTLMFETDRSDTNTI